MKLHPAEEAKLADARSYMRTVPPATVLTIWQRHLRDTLDIVERLRHPWRTRFRETRRRVRAAAGALRGDR
jgi:hypothetical protein